MTFWSQGLGCRDGPIIDARAFLIAFIIDLVWSKDWKDGDKERESAPTYRFGRYLCGTTRPSGAKDVSQKFKIKKEDQDYIRRVVSVPKEKISDT